MSEELSAWIDRQCGLSELAESLREICLREGTLADYVGAILEVAGYAESSRVKKIQEFLRQDESLNIFERKKKRADSLTAEQKFYYGLDLYRQLLREIPEEETELRTDVLYNCGVIYAKLFYYEIALDFLDRALKLSTDSRIRKAYLYCKRCTLSREKYVEFTVQYPQFYEDSLTLESEIARLKEKWERSDRKADLDQLFVSGGEIELNSRREKMQQQLERWEKEYQIMIKNC